MDRRMETRRRALRTSLRRGVTLGASAMAAGIMLMTPLSTAAAPIVGQQTTRQMTMPTTKKAVFWAAFQNVPSAVRARS